MPANTGAAVRQALRLIAYVGLSLLVYWANAATPPTARLAVLYLIPVLLVTWTEGLIWGIIFAVATTALREAVAQVQMLPDTPMVWRIATAVAYIAVMALAMAGLQTLRRSQAALARLVTQDQLTNVLNARAFTERLGQELERNRRYPHALALMYMDLDNFKVINDTHGHQTGDAVLRLVADAMRSSVRQADVVGRLGGDEFAVLMPETDATLADAAAKRLIAGLRNVFKGTPNVTASIGVVSCTATDASTDDLLRRADQAMYDAKKSGKDRVVQVAL
ncbi:MAG TPA: GGDEF domain-containing protein [Gemmatimonadales bacterium]|nr:GGDEF domain-containing protein [Gemmatimonadales bacterium]